MTSGHNFHIIHSFWYLFTFQVYLRMKRRIHVDFVSAEDGCEQLQLINSRPHHPHTNGKLERFHKSIEAEIHHYESLSEYIKYYNEGRLHFSLDIQNYETPRKSFSAKKATDAIRKKYPQ